jgi:hypothetical protein
LIINHYTKQKKNTSYQFIDTPIGEYQSLDQRVKQLGQYMAQPITSNDIDTSQLTLLCTALDQVNTTLYSLMVY